MGNLTLLRDAVLTWKGKIDGKYYMDSVGHTMNKSGGFVNDADVEVIFAEGTKYIPGNICWNRVESTLLKRIVIPESVKEIGERAFQNCLNRENHI